MLRNTTDTEYLVNEDIRFYAGDTVDLYTFWRFANGTVQWESALERTLLATGLVISELTCAILAISYLV